VFAVAPSEVLHGPSLVSPPSRVMAWCVRGSQLLAVVALFDTCAALDKLKFYLPMLLVVCFQQH
jgi:hypothetical protein